MTDLKNKVKSTAEHMKHAVSETAHKLGHAASEAVEKTDHKVSEAAGKVNTLADEGATKAGEVETKVADTIERALHSAGDKMNATAAKMHDANKPKRTSPQK